MKFKRVGYSYEGYKFQEIRKADFKVNLTSVTPYDQVAVLVGRNLINIYHDAEYMLNFIHYVFHLSELPMV